MASRNLGQERKKIEYNSLISPPIASCTNASLRISYRIRINPYGFFFSLFDRALSNSQVKLINKPICLTIFIFRSWH